MDDKELASRLAETKFVVEANSNEMQCIWEKYSNEAMFIRPGINIYKFEQLNPGVAITIGHLDNRPINLSLFWWKINGVMIMTHTIVSQVADHAKEDDWLKKNCSPRWDRGTRRAHVDAMNFHHVLEYVRDEKSR